jgi:hypothetical protein
MAWLWWQQHRADRAEARAIRLYIERGAGQRELRDCIIDAGRRDEAMVRLNTALGGDPRS